MKSEVKIKAIFISILTIIIISLASCDDNDPKDVDDNTETITEEIPEEVLPPVETNSPNSDYSPAFEGQTRINGVQTKTEYSITIIASGLNRPWGMTNLPDGRILITEKEGVMRIISVTGSVGTAISGISEVNSEGQGGLLDVAIDPEFDDNRIVYWTFSKNGTVGTATAVAKGRLSDDETQIENAEVIYIAYPEFDGKGHYGSRIVWDNIGNMYVSTGERAISSIRGKAQDLNAAIGKVLHLTRSGEPVPGGPYENTEGALPEIFSYGHRNVQGLAIHPVSGDLWELEFGPKGGDEVNRLEAGKNYGWPIISYGIEYSGDPLGEGITQKNGMEQPVYYWDPAISPSGITFYANGEITEWNNNLFVAALSGKHIIRLVIENNLVVGEERLMEEENKRFRDVLQGKDGALYAITDGSGANLYRIGL